MHRALVLAIAGLLLFRAEGAGAASAPRYEIDVVLRPEAGEIEGTARIRLQPAGDRALFHLYPNRFRVDGDEVDDVTRRYVYPLGVFEPGWIAIDRVASATGHDLAYRLTRVDGAAPDTLLEVDLPHGDPSSPVTIAIAFRTRVPERFGPFGVTDQGLAAVGGWHPYLVARDEDGGWHPDWAPPAADIDAHVQAPPDRPLVLGELVFRSGHPGRVQTSARAVRNLGLLAPIEPEIVDAGAGDTTVHFVEPREARTFRVGSPPGPDRRFRSLVLDALARRPPTLAAPAELTVAQIPLRWNLTSQSDAPVIASDRSMHVHEILGGFHGAQVAQAVYAALLRPRILACEPPASQNWVQQGIAWALADRFLRAADENHRSVHDWIGWLNFFAIVDRFESSPKIPFVAAFFEDSLTDDELRESVFTYVRREPGARLSFARIDREIGSASLSSAVDDYLDRLDGPCTTFAESLQRAQGTSGAHIRSEIRSARAPVVPDGPRARVDLSLRSRRKRSTYQFVLDSADIDVSSSQFGVGGLFVFRKRYDYTRDIALAPYLNERSYGVRAGPRLHLGERNDPNLYRHNLYAFYQLSGLISGFKDDSRPDVRTEGAIAGFGLRYDYSDVYWFNDPTQKRELSLFVDAYDPSLGGDYGYVRYGARARGTVPLGSVNTLAALELLAGFEESFSGRGIPIQEQYALGGQLAIRGISVNEELARNIGLARLEIRQAVYPELDLNLLDFLAYRRPQLRLFVDTGNVDDSAGRAMNPSHWAVGGGIGINVLYDFMGFFPGSAYVEVATRFDRDPQDVQVLFGTRQAF